MTHRLLVFKNFIVDLWSFYLLDGLVLCDICLVKQCRICLIKWQLVFLLIFVVLVLRCNK